MERELLLLGLLRQEDMHGYRLAEFINRDLAFCTDLKKPTAYYLLGKMADAGWVTRSEDRAGHRPTRQIYAITPEGEATFRRLLRDNLSTSRPVTFTDDIGLAFIDVLPPEEGRSLLDQRRAVLAEVLAQARTIPEHGGSMQLVIRHRVHHLESELAWLDSVIAQMAPVDP